MSSGLLLRDREDVTTKALAPVISIQSAIKEPCKQKEEAPKMKAEKKTPLFYAKPIFKSKKHDFL
jgi:hypothetical protein